MTSKSTPIVIDNGTFEIKVGLSNSKKPKIVPTVIGFEYGNVTKLLSP
jgi:actin-related protein